MWPKYFNLWTADRLVVSVKEVSSKLVFHAIESLAIVFHAVFRFSIAFFGYSVVEFRTFVDLSDRVFAFLRFLVKIGKIKHVSLKFLITTNLSSFFISKFHLLWMQSMDQKMAVNLSVAYGSICFASYWIPFSRQEWINFFGVGHEVSVCLVGFLRKNVATMHSQLHCKVIFRARQKNVWILVWY